MGVGEGIRVEPEFFPIRLRKHSIKSKKRKRKRRYSCSATNITSDNDSSDYELAIKKFKVVTEKEWSKCKISKLMASFANERF